MAYAVIGAATAEISAQAVPDLFGGWIGMLVEKRFGGHDETGSTKTAL